ncbi:MAG: hypothetical protein GWP08_18070 [Nitrospiraceae bacterium]|nr:hypothetical protein [Nitrospiraceae bacterium]
MPFDLTLTGYAKNTIPQSAGQGASADTKIIDGFSLRTLPPEREYERNSPGAYVVAEEHGTDQRQEGIVWGRSRAPFTVSSDGKQWAVALRTRRWQLPFTITLDKFTRELYPGTNMPKTFASDVTKLQDGVRQQSRISMNEPLRISIDGRFWDPVYTFYQSSWGPANAGPDDRLFSTFAVVRNPAEQFPLYACLIVTLGMTIHFAQKLLRYLRRVSGETASAARTVCAVIAAVLFAATADAAPGDSPKWDAETTHLFATLPIQDSGRIKPINTFASVHLFKINGKRSCKNLAGEKLSSAEWLLDVLFVPEAAMQYKTFRVDNSEVMVALGLPFVKKRDRYSYESLHPARTKLLTLAREYDAIPAQQRMPVQTQLVNLAHNLLDFESLLGFLEFARHPFSVSEIEPLAKLFPDQPNPRLSDLLANGTALIEVVSTLKDDAGDPSDKQAAADLEAVLDMLRRIDDLIGSATAMRLIPLSGASTEAQWFTPKDLAERAFAGTEQSMTSQFRILALLEKMVESSDDPERFRETLASLHAESTDLAKARGEYGQIELEVAFYRAKIFYYSLILYVFSFVLIALSWLKPGNRIMSKASIVSVIVPTALLVCGITVRCVIRGRPPVTTLYETILFTTAVIAVIAIFLEIVNRQKVALTIASLLGVLGLFIANKYEIREGVDTMPSMVAVLDTNFWLATHVTTITIGYGAGLLAAALAHVYILGKAFRVKRDDSRFYRQLTRTIYGVLCFSLLFSILGTVLGGIWANESWGRFWGWDPKENGALMIVLWQLAVLHARLGGYLRDLGVSLAAIFGGVIVAFSWFGVNLLGVGLHSYGFTSGVFRVLIAFYIAEAAFLLLGACVWFWEDHLHMAESGRQGTP